MTVEEPVQAPFDGEVMDSSGGVASGMNTSIGALHDPLPSLHTALTRYSYVADSDRPLSVRALCPEATMKYVTPPGPERSTSYPITSITACSGRPQSRAAELPEISHEKEVGAEAGAA